MDLKLLWENAFQKAIGEQQEATNSNPLDWRVGGRATKANPNKENGDWWATNGYDMFTNFTQWWQGNQWQVWSTPSGHPAIEIELMHVFGDIPVKAYADLVAVTPDGELAIVDYKTGSYLPENGMQLGLYATIIEQRFGIRPSVGYFYSAREATMHRVENMDIWTEPLFTELFRQFELGLKNKIFLPSISMMCKSCSVSKYCYTFTGNNTIPGYDPLQQIGK